ncbi:MAG: PAS domain S-box protein, partial [Gammaproteobacteria bacterium]|nr:PAS domain S-box protein [Gammaproteobacteria bacterium]
MRNNESNEPRASMHQEIRQRIKEASEKSGNNKLDFLALLKLIDEHYDKMEATITQSFAQSLATTTTTPIEVIFDSVTDALISVNSAGHIRNCNKVCSRYFGLSKDQLIGANIATILPAAANQPLANFLDPFMSSLDDTNIEFNGGEVEAARADGQHFIAEINSSSLEVGDDRVFVISLRDITGRKLAEKTLRENEERYRALVENAPEAIVVLDVDRNIFSDANENACNLFNMSRARLLSVGPKAISPRMQPDGTPSFGIRRGHIDKALAGGHPIFEWMHKDANGKEIPCEVRFSRLPDAERKLIRVSISNIEDRKRNEDFAFAQNKILEMIAASSPLDRTLKSICQCIDRMGGGMRAAVMKLDVRNQTLSVEQAPGLPEPFKLALDFIRVDENAIACGAAVFANREKIVADISGDPAWARLHGVAAKYNVAAAWSFPLHGAAARIIGTLDVYLNQPKEPGTDDLDKIGRMARLAGIAIKRQIDEDRLKSSESRYRGLFENVVDGV